MVMNRLYEYYVVYCSWFNNFIKGPFGTIEEAKEAAKGFNEFKILQVNQVYKYQKQTT